MLFKNKLKNKLKNLFHLLFTRKQKRGMVLVIVLSTIAFLLVVIQEVAFDSQVELKNGVAQYQRLKAFHAAKSGIQMALLKIMVYKKLHTYIDSNKQLELARSYLNLLWNQEQNFPPVFPDNISETIKEEINEKVRDSLFKDSSYKVIIQAESSKLDLSGFISPIPHIRDWTRQTLLNLLMNLRKKHTWIANKYSENNLIEITQNIQNSLNPTGSESLVNKLIYPTLLDINDLRMIDPITPEIIEFIRPYVTLFGEYGINLTYADPFLIQSLGENIMLDKAIELSTKLNEETISKLEGYERVFNTLEMNSLSDYYFSEGADRPSMAQLVLNTDAPQNFKIISYGFSGGLSRGIEISFYDPSRTASKAYSIFELYKQALKYPSSGSSSKKPSIRQPISIQVSPFIIYWKDIN